MRPVSFTHMRARRTLRDGGFTLPELIAIVVLTAIVAATAAPSLSKIGEVRDSLAARQALRDLTHARQRAIATGTRCWVTFDVGTHSWSVLSENPAVPGRAGALPITDPATGRPYTQTVGEGVFHGVNLVTVDFDGGTEIGFDWRGRPLNTTGADLISQGTIVFTGSQIVTIEPETGHVRRVSQ